MSDETYEDLKRWARTADLPDPLDWGALEARIEGAPRPSAADMEWQRSEMDRTSPAFALLAVVLLAPMVLLTMGTALVGLGIVAAYVVGGRELPDTGGPVLNLVLVGAILVPPIQIAIWASTKRRDAQSLVTAGLSAVASTASFVLLAAGPQRLSGIWPTAQLLTLVGAITGWAVTAFLLLVATPSPRRTFAEWRGQRDESAEEFWLRLQRLGLLESLVKRGRVAEADTNGLRSLPWGTWRDLESLPGGRVVRRATGTGRPPRSPGSAATPTPEAEGWELGASDFDVEHLGGLARWAGSADLGDPVRWAEVEERILAEPTPRRKVMRRDQEHSGERVTPGQVLGMVPALALPVIPTVGAPLVGLALVLVGVLGAGGLPFALEVVLVVELVIAVLVGVASLLMWVESRRRSALSMALAVLVAVGSLGSLAVLVLGEKPASGPWAIVTVLVGVGAAVGTVATAFLLVVARPAPGPTWGEWWRRQRETPEEHWSRRARGPVLDQMRRRGLVSKADAEAVQGLPVGAWAELESLPGGRVVRRS